ncbi:MAG: hypothetical protein CM15mP45_03740 [Deltaproteobacteria bacterium]|nr:MAG: hypothetical protein CM15mP45_03740 [Deltaproteobacteria bacterium]
MWFQHLLGWVHLIGTLRPGAPYRLNKGQGGFESIVTATLASVAFKTEICSGDAARRALAPKLIRVDGGMVNNTWFAQRLADFLSVPGWAGLCKNHRPRAAYLAGLRGFFPAISDLGLIAGVWETRRFEAQWDSKRVDDRYGPAAFPGSSFFSPE